MATKKRKKPAVKAKSKSKSKAKKAKARPKQSKSKRPKAKPPARKRKSKQKRPTPKSKPKKPKRQKAPKRKAPKNNRRQADGTYLDGSRVVPRTRKVRRKPVPPPRMVPVKPRRKAVPRAEVHFVPPGRAIGNRPMISTTFDNVRSPIFAGEIINNTINRMVRKKRDLNKKDFVLYQYGVHFVNTTQSGDLDEMSHFVNQLAYEYPDTTLKFSGDNLHVMFGSEKSPTTVKRAVSDLRDNHEMLTAIWDYLNQLWDGDCGWFVVAENDEYEGKSG